MNPPLIAVLVLAAIIIALMLFKRPRPTALPNPQAAESARLGVGALRNILVPISGEAHSERSVELACRIGLSHKAKIHLLYVLSVPRSLPLQNPLPDKETLAKSAISRAESIVKSHEMECVTQVIRARGVGEGILQIAKESKPDVIVIGIKSAYNAEKGSLGSTTNLILSHAPCEVIIDKMPGEPEEEESITHSADSTLA